MPAVKSSGYDRFCRNEDDYSDDGCSSYDSYGYDNGDDDEEYKQWTKMKSSVNKWSLNALKSSYLLIFNPHYKYFLDLLWLL